MSRRLVAWWALETVLSFSFFVVVVDNFQFCHCAFIISFILYTLVLLHSLRAQHSWITLENGKTTADAMGDVWRGLEVVEAASRVGSDMLVRMFVRLFVRSFVRSLPLVRIFAPRRKNKTRE